MLIPTVIISIVVYLIGYRQGRKNKRKVEDNFCETIVGDREPFWRHNFHNQYENIIEYKN